MNASPWCEVVEPRGTSAHCRMWKDLDGKVNPQYREKSWYVFETEYGGQVLASVPVSLVPAWVGRRRLRRALKAMGGCQFEGASVYIAVDVGANPSLTMEYDEANAREFHEFMEATTPWIARTVTKLPVGVSAASMFDGPLTQEVLRRNNITWLRGWTIVGQIPGGMGGGGLLKDDAWFHYGLMSDGEERINELRRLLGLPKLQSFDLVMSDDDRWHADLMQAVLG